jgi:hypothetical protein
VVKEASDFFSPLNFPALPKGKYPPSVAVLFGAAVVTRQSVSEEEAHTVGPVFHPEQPR